MTRYERTQRRPGRAFIDSGIVGTGARLSLGRNHVMLCAGRSVRAPPGIRVESWMRRGGRVREDVQYRALHGKTLKHCITYVQMIVHSRQTESGFLRLLPLRQVPLPLIPSAARAGHQQRWWCGSATADRGTRERHVVCGPLYAGTRMRRGGRASMVAQGRALHNTTPKHALHMYR